jgi:hypothetical protein
VDHRAGLLPDDVPSEEHARARVGDELHHPERVPVDKGALVVLEPQDGGLDLVADLARLALGETDARDLGIAVRDARNPVVPRPRGRDVSTTTLGLVRANVREQQLAGGVARRPHVRVRRAERLGQDGTPSLVQRDPGGRQVVDVEHRLPPGRDEELVRSEGLAAGERDGPPPSVVLGALDRDAGAERDALGLEGRGGRPRRPRPRSAGRGGAPQGR